MTGATLKARARGVQQPRTDDLLREAREPRERKERNAFETFPTLALPRSGSRVCSQARFPRATPRSHLSWAKAPLDSFALLRCEHPARAGVFSRYRNDSIREGGDQRDTGRVPGSAQTARKRDSPWVSQGSPRPISSACKDRCRAPPAPARSRSSYSRQRGLQGRRHSMC